MFKIRNIEFAKYNLFEKVKKIITLSFSSRTAMFGLCGKNTSIPQRLAE